MKIMASFIEQPQKKCKISERRKFESLANELLIEIFNYLSFADLYRSFKGLNQRIDHLLQSLHKRGLRLWSTKEEDIEIHQFFVGNAVALNITNEYDLDLKLFPNVHSLTYVSATDVQLQNLLQATLSHQHLTYLNVVSDDLSSLVQHIFSNGFPSLHQCRLRHIDEVPIFSWTILSSLRSINITSEESLITPILSSCPNLTRLSLYTCQYDFIPPVSSFVHHHLQYLSMDVEQPAWTVSSIETLLSSIRLPHLLSFCILSSSSSNVPFDFVQLAQILDKYVPHLRRFDCDLFLSPMIATADLETIRHAHAFLFRHLQFEHQSNGRLLIFPDNTKH